MRGPDYVAHELSGFVSRNEAAQRGERAALGIEGSAVSGRTEVPSHEVSVLPGAGAGRYEDEAPGVQRRNDDGLRQLDLIRRRTRVPLIWSFQPDAENGADISICDSDRSWSQVAPAGKRRSAGQQLYVTL